MKTLRSLLFPFFLLSALTVQSIAQVTSTQEDPHNKADVLSAFGKSFSSIVVSELGDKTFFIAAIMAMRYNRIAVLCGALLALFLMTLLSTAFGYLLPTILPASVTHLLITVLFFFFGGKLLYDAYHEEEGDNNEQAEVEIELNQMHSKLMKSANSSSHRQEAQIEHIDDDNNGNNRRRAATGGEERAEDSESDSPTFKRKGGNCAKEIEQIASKMIFWQALTMTFLGEWGDRSQISTIALAAESNAYFVFIGGFLGHVLCTSLAVIGGKFLAKKISERTVNICGGILFLLFGIHNLFQGTP